MAGGGLMQLVAYGAQDVYLTGNPQITFFKVVYRRHTNFSSESIEQTINGTSTIATAATSGTVTISRNGDLVGRVVVTCDQDTSNGVNGDKLVNEVSLEIGGQEIDKHTEEWMQVWSELTVPESKAAGYKYMTGGFNNTLVSGGLDAVGGTSQQMIQVPLQFSFCRNPGLALPLIALQYHEVKLKFTWGTSASVGRSGSATPNVAVWADYFYLDTDERRRFAQVSHEYLIEQLQYQTEGSPATKYKLNFNHPVKELVWTNGTSATVGSTILTQKAKITLNGHDRFAQRDREYFQLRQPMDHHTSVPGYNIKEFDRPILLAAPIDSGITSENDTPLGLTAVTIDANATGTGSMTYAAGQTIPFDVGDLFVTALEPASSIATVAGGLMHQVTAVSATVVTFTPDLEGPPTSGDAMKVFIVARTQTPESRCSQLIRDINVYSFALKPEEHQPSGTCNFSRIDTAYLEFDASATVEVVYAVNYNVLRIMSGMGGLAYSN
jgi:hypothetical protein